MKKFLRARGFSLIEIMLSVIILGIVFSVAAGSFYKAVKDWQRQRNSLRCLENARWAMEYLSNEIRQGNGASTGVTNAGGVKAKCRTQIYSVIDPGAQNGRIWYWRGEQQGGNNYGDPSIIYRGMDINPVLASQPQSFQEANGNRKELCNYVVDNPNGDEIFTDMGGGVYRIEISVRPDPARPNTIEGNKDFTLRTYVHPRN